MTVGATILADLQRRGVVVKTNGDRLRLDAPVGVLTPDVVDRVKHHKSQVLAILRSEPNRTQWDPLVPAGWTAEAWHGRLVYLAKICMHADRSRELEQWAATVREVHGLVQEHG